MSSARIRAVIAWGAALALALGLAVGVAPAQASADAGYEGHSYAGARRSATADKPQSKLWFHDGRWWASMLEPTTQDWHIYRLDRASHRWVDTGVLLDERVGSSADTLWDGSKLYVASHAVKSSTGVSEIGKPARLFRYSYSTATRSFVRDAGFPGTINDVSSESLTIDKDTRGILWATWTQTDASGSTVYVNSSADGGATWGTPMVLPAQGSNPRAAADDISAVVAYQDKVGVLWSNQTDDTVYWAVHRAGAPAGSWTGGPAVRGGGIADDHMNLKSLSSDYAGRVFAVVKSGANHLDDWSNSDTAIALLHFKPGTGAWSSSTVATFADCNTRPQVVLDESNSRVHVVMTGPTGGGTCVDGMDGAIYLKSASMDSPVFAAGQGQIIIRDADAEGLNNATTTKQAVTGASGLVVLAGNSITDRYWHAEVPIGPGTTTPSGGAIAERYNVLGGTTGFLGQPVSAETATPSGGAYRRFQGGTIYWSAATGPRVVQPPVLGRYARMGAERSVLRYPITDQRTTVDGRGRYNEFQGGSIYWSRLTGARALHGPVRAKWVAMGRVGSVLKYPTTDVRVTRDGRGRFAHFQGGSIFWSRATGAKALVGPIRDKYLAVGGVSSRLRYPTSGVYAIKGGKRANFQGGWITWTRARGAYVTLR